AVEKVDMFQREIEQVALKGTDEEQMAAEEILNRLEEEKADESKGERFFAKLSKRAQSQRNLDLEVNLQPSRQDIIERKKKAAMDLQEKVKREEKERAEAFLKGQVRILPMDRLLERALKNAVDEGNPFDIASVYKQVQAMEGATKEISGDLLEIARLVTGRLHDLATTINKDQKIVEMKTREAYTQKQMCIIYRDLICHFLDKGDTKQVRKFQRLHFQTRKKMSRLVTKSSAEMKGEVVLEEEKDFDHLPHFENDGQVIEVSVLESSLDGDQKKGGGTWGFDREGNRERGSCRSVIDSACMLM
ncbi:hypothetical protein AAMO2058_001720200, partial [Amorphochlora amoebiformis]